MLPFKKRFVRDPRDKKVIDSNMQVLLTKLSFHILGQFHALIIKLFNGPAHLPCFQFFGGRWAFKVALYTNMNVIST